MSRCQMSKCQNGGVGTQGHNDLSFGHKNGFPFFPFLCPKERALRTSALSLEAIGGSCAQRRASDPQHESEAVGGMRLSDSSMPANEGTE